MLRACSVAGLFLAFAGIGSASAVTLRAGQVPAAPAAAAPAPAAAGGRLKAVIDTLQDLLASIQQQEKEDAKNNKCSMEWCEKETTTKQSEIDAADAKLDDLNILIRQCATKSTALQYEIDMGKKEAAELSDSMAQAKGIRDDQKAKYDKETTTNTQSIAQLDQAIKIVGKVHKAGGFLQNGVVTRLQLNEPGESNFVLGVMKSLKTTLVVNKKQADKDEANKQALYDTLMTTKQNQLKATTEQSSSKTTKLTEVKTQAAQAKNDVATLTSSRGSIKDYLFDTKNGCDKKAKEFQLQTTDRQAEKAAISEAISFLTITLKEQKGPTVALSFVQTQAVSLTVASGLVGVADAELAQLQGSSSSAKKGTFSKVKKIVAELITNLLNEQKEETKKKDYCVSELKKKATEKENNDDELKALTSSINSKVADVAALVQEVKELETAISQSKLQNEQAKKLRMKQKADFDAASKERLLALKVLKQATQVLTKFYESDNKATPAQTQGGGRRTVEANAVLAMMEKITNNVSKEQADAAKAEQDQVSAYEKLVVDSQKEFDRRTGEITTRVERKARLLVQTDAQKEDQAQSATSLEAVKQQILGLKSDCDELIKNHDSREKARGFEISQLRDVNDILSGSEVAARTGLLQSGSLAVATGGQAGRSDASLRDISRALDDLESRARSVEASQ